MNGLKQGRRMGRQWIIAILGCGLMAAVFTQGCGGAGERAVVDTVTVDSANTDVPVNPEDEIRRLTEQMKFSPTNYELYYKRSLLYYELGNTVQAVQDMEKSKEYNITNPEAWHMLGFYAYVQNDEELALRYLKNATQQGSENPETFYLMGQIHFLKGNYKDAEGYYSSAIKMDSLSPTYLFAQGFSEQTQGHTNKAIDWYKQSLEVDPGFVKALTQLHDIYRNDKKDYPQAMAFNDRILQVDSMHPVGRFNQGLFFLQRAENITDESKAAEYEVLMKLAISEFGKAVVKDPNFANAYYNRGYCYFMLEQYQKALDDFSSVIEKDPFSYKSFFYQGAIYEYHKDTTAAIGAYRQALQINPNLREAGIAIKELSVKGK